MGMPADWVGLPYDALERLLYRRLVFCFFVFIKIVSALVMQCNAIRK